MKKEQAKKFDEGKLRYDLLPPAALDEVVKVFMMGAEKYGDYNWTKGLKFSRCFAAIMRHLWQWWRGEDIDSESGLPHLAHAIATIMFLLTFARYRRVELDDRPVIPFLKLEDVEDAA